MADEEEIQWPGQRWYQGFSDLRKRANEVRSGLEGPIDPLAEAHFVLIELADWRWLERSHLRRGSPIGTREYEKPILRWAEAMGDEERPLRDRLVLAEAVLWGTAAMERLKSGAKQRVGRQPLDDAVEVLSLLPSPSDQVNADSPPWTQLLLAIRAVSPEGKAGPSKLLPLKVTPPYDHLKIRLMEYLDKWVVAEERFVTDPVQGVPTLEATLQAVEATALRLDLMNWRDPRYEELRALVSRIKLRAKFNSAIESYQGEQKPVARKRADHWDTELNPLWWSGAVAMRWTLGDSTVYKLSWELLVDEALTHFDNLELDQIKKVQTLRALAEGALVFTDTEPEKFTTTKHRLLVAVRSVIKDSQIARMIGERLTRELRSQKREE